MKKYKICFIKKYFFELEGDSEENISEQVIYVCYKTKILDMPFVKKETKIVMERIIDNEKDN